MFDGWLNNWIVGKLDKKIFEKFGTWMVSGWVV